MKNIQISNEGLQKILILLLPFTIALISYSFTNYTENNENILQNNIEIQKINNKLNKIEREKEFYKKILLIKSRSQERTNKIPLPNENLTNINDINILEDKINEHLGETVIDQGLANQNSPETYPHYYKLINASKNILEAEENYWKKSQQLLEIYKKPKING